MAILATDESVPENQVWEAVSLETAITSHPDSELAADR